MIELLSALGLLMLGALAGILIMCLMIIASGGCRRDDDEA